MGTTLIKKPPMEFPEKWEKTDDAYTGNNVMLIENIIKATEISETLLHKAYQKKFNLLAIHLKADNISTFTALFVADFNEYLSDEFREVYLLANKLKQEVQRENFNIYFSFTHNSPNPSEEILANDGFFLKYEKK